MRTFLLRRLLQLVPLLLAVIVLTFALLAAAPGDYVTTVAADPQVPTATLEAMRHRFGLDRPWPVQLGLYVRNLVLGLDRGGSCVGVAYRLSQPTREQAIARLFEREIPDPVIRIYQPKVIGIRLRGGETVQALTFIADRSRPSYQRLSDVEVLERLAVCHGERGANREYAINTWEALRARGVHDARLMRLVRQLMAQR